MKTNYSRYNMEQDRKELQTVVVVIIHPIIKFLCD